MNLSFPGAVSAAKRMPIKTNIGKKRKRPSARQLQKRKEHNPWTMGGYGGVLGSGIGQTAGSGSLMGPTESNVRKQAPTEDPIQSDLGFDKRKVPQYDEFIQLMQKVKPGDVQAEIDIQAKTNVDPDDADFLAYTRYMAKMTERRQTGMAKMNRDFHKTAATGRSAYLGHKEDIKAQIEKIKAV